MRLEVKVSSFACLAYIFLMTKCKWLWVSLHRHPWNHQLCDSSISTSHTKLCSDEISLSSLLNCMSRSNQVAGCWRILSMKHK